MPLDKKKMNCVNFSLCYTSQYFFFYITSKLCKRKQYRGSDSAHAQRVGCV